MKKWQEKTKIQFLLTLFLFFITPLAFAHTDAATLSGGFMSGFMHPLTGLDHVVAMVAVGLWGAFLGKPAIWILPIVFPLVMAFGGALGVAGVPIPYIETGIALSGPRRSFCNTPPNLGCSRNCRCFCHFSWTRTRSRITQSNKSSGFQYWFCNRNRFITPCRYCNRRVNSLVMGDLRGTRRRWNYCINRTWVFNRGIIKTIACKKHLAR